MSISSMTNIAVLKNAGADVTTYKGLEQAATQPAQSDVTAALKAIASYIPSEVLTVYVGVLAALQNGNKLPPSALTAFWIFVFVTPAVVWLVYAAKVRAAGKPLPWALTLWPVWEMSAATIAFAAWGIALPDNPFKESSWYSSALAGILVVIISTALGLIAPIIQKK